MYFLLTEKFHRFQLDLVRLSYMYVYYTKETFVDCCTCLKTDALKMNKKKMTFWNTWLRSLSECSGRSCSWEHEGGRGHKSNKGSGMVRKQETCNSKREIKYYCCFLLKTKNYITNGNDFVLCWERSEKWNMRSRFPHWKKEKSSISVSLRSGTQERRALSACWLMNRTNCHIHT